MAITESVPGVYVTKCSSSPTRLFTGFSTVFSTGVSNGVSSGHSNSPASGSVISAGSGSGSAPAGGSGQAGEAILTVTDLTQRVTLGRDTLTILQGVSLEIKRGESVAIVGRSGSGKTTLLGLLAGLDTPTEGEVILEGKAISRLSEDERAALRARRVGFVFQSFQLLPALTALENVMLPLELTSHPQPRVRARELLQRVGLGDRLGHTPRQLSGGEQQRVAIARAFACEPVILFADEPTGNLDNQTGQDIQDLLMTLNREQGTTLVMVTHDETLAARCQRRLTIEAGRLETAVERGTA